MEPLRPCDRATVRLKAAYFEVITPDQGEEAIKDVLAKWFRGRAKDQFSRRMETWKPWCKKHHLPEPVLKIRRMPKRWGSAGLAGRLL